MKAPKPVRLDDDGHAIARFLERYKPWENASPAWSPQLRHERAEKLLLSELPKATYVMTEDDSKQAIWRTELGIVLVVDMEATVRTVLEMDAAPRRSYRPVK